MRVKPSARKRPPGLAASLAVAGAAACILAAAGCGTTGPAGTSGKPGSGSGGTAPAQSKIVLDITLTHAAGAGRTHWTLRCDPPGGNDPGAAAACATLLSMKDPFTLPRGHVNCPMIMASDKVYLVTGTWHGTKVHSAVADGGCGLSLFGKLKTILH